MTSAEAAPAASYDEFTEDKLKPVDGDSLSVLHALAADFLAAQTAMLAAEEAFKKAKAAFEDIEQKRIPDWMEEHGLTKPFDHTDPATGAHTVIKCSDTTNYTLPADHRDAAYAWFESIGKGGIIAHVMEADIGKQGGNVTGVIKSAIEKAASEAGVEKIEVTTSKSIHASTLSATCRALAAEGKHTIPEYIKPFRQRKATVRVS